MCNLQHCNQGDCIMTKTIKPDFPIVKYFDDYDRRTHYGKFEVVAMLQQIQHALHYYERKIVSGQFKEDNIKLANEMQREVRVLAKAWRIIRNGKVWLA